MTQTHQDLAWRCREWLRDVDYCDWLFGVERDGTDKAYLVITAKTPDNDDPFASPRTWRSRKWRLSKHMTKSEVIATALSAVLMAVEHEARERFRYRGQSIYSPHYDVDILHAARTLPDALDGRPETTPI